MKFPNSSTIPMRSPSPSTPMPNSAPCSTTILPRSSMFAGRVGSGGWTGKVLSQSHRIQVASAPNAFKIALTKGPGTAFPESTTNFTVRRGLPADSMMESKYCSWKSFTFTNSPSPRRNSPASKTSRSFCNSSPAIAAVPRHILKPLYSGGL